MGQVTIARFQGDTTFALLARVVATCLGGVGGMAMWSVTSILDLSLLAQRVHYSRYISCGSGRGNAFGLAAVSAVCFPFIFFARLYWPGPPMTIIVFAVTCLLVRILRVAWACSQFGPAGYWILLSRRAPGHTWISGLWIYGCVGMYVAWSEVFHAHRVLHFQRRFVLVVAGVFAAL